MKEREKILNVPNVLTMIRALLIPVYWVLFMNGRHYIALAVFIIASLTDYVDGYIARKYGQVSDFGKFLDPLADKLLVISAMAMFCQWGTMPAWALMIVLTREFAVTGLRLVAAPKGNVIAAGWSGKVKTASTMIGLCCMMGLHEIPAFFWIPPVVIGVIVVTTVYSGVEYFIQNWKCLWE